MAACRLRRATGRFDLRAADCSQLATALSLLPAIGASSGYCASNFLNCRLDLEAEINYLRAKGELQWLLEMPKSQRLLPQHQGQTVAAGTPKYDIQRFPEMTNEEWQANALKLRERDYPKQPEAPPAPPDSAVQEHADSRSPDTTGQSSPESNTSGSTSDASASSPPNQPIGEWGRPLRLKLFNRST